MYGSLTVAGSLLLRFFGDYDQGEAVVAFAADGLDGRGGDAGFGSEQFIEAANTLNDRSAARGVYHGAVSDHVVNDDHGPATRKFERPFEVGRVVFFVGVNEDQVERASALGGELGQGVESAPNAQVHDIGETRAGDVRTR